MFSNICTQVLLVYFHDELWPKPVMIASQIFVIHHIPRLSFLFLFFPIFCVTF